MQTPALMRYFIMISAIVPFSDAFGQIKPGIYRQSIGEYYVDLKIFQNNKFSFYDTRASSCWLWGKYEGNWRIDNDTVTFSWQSFWQENTVDEHKSIDKTSNDVFFTFRYDDGEPIPGVRICYSCDWSSNCNYFQTNTAGQLRLPKYITINKDTSLCKNSVRRLAYEIKSKFTDFSTSGQQDSASNVFVITVKKHLKSGYVTEKRRFLLRYRQLIYIDPIEKNIFKNWGNFVFFKKQQPAD